MEINVTRSEEERLALSDLSEGDVFRFCPGEADDEHLCLLTRVARDVAKFVDEDGPWSTHWIIVDLEDGTAWPLADKSNDNRKVVLVDHTLEARG